MPLAFAIPDKISSVEVATNSKWAITLTANPIGLSCDTDGDAKFGVHYPVP